MKILKQLFIDHPASVGETYVEHAFHAAKFGAAMLLGALACFLHAVVPVLCTTIGSRTIARLHDQMVVNRSSPQSGGLSESSQPDCLAEHI
jgi:hypothetical protein